MTRRLMNNLVTLVVAGTGLALAGPALGVDASTGVRATLGGVWQTLRQTEAQMDVLDAQVAEQHVKVQELAWKFESGADPEFIAAGLEEVERTLNMLELDLFDLSVTLRETTEKLYRIRDTARRLRDPNLMREVEAAIAFSANLGRRTKGSEEAIDTVRADINRLKSQIG